MVFAGALNAQCKTRNDSPKKEEALDAHSVYRPYVKGASLTEAPLYRPHGSGDRQGRARAGDGGGPSRRVGDPLASVPGRVG